MHLRVLTHRARVAMPIVLAASIFALASCATSTPPLQEFAAKEHLTPSRDPERPLQFHAPGAALSGYTKVLVEPVAFYGGLDAHFGKSISADDRDRIGKYMLQTFTETLSEGFHIVTKPESATLRLSLTITGIEANKPVIAGISHLAPFGIVLNAGKQAAGSNGTGFGSVSYVVELSDAQTGKVVYAYVTHQTPDALDVTAGFGRLDGARTGIRIGAKHLLADLKSQTAGCVKDCQAATL